MDRVYKYFGIAFIVSMTGLSHSSNGGVAELESQNSQSIGEVSVPPGDAWSTPGGLTTVEIWTVIKSNLWRQMICWQNYQSHLQTTRVDLTVRWAINADGTVRRVEPFQEDVSNRFKRCIWRSVKQWKFPPLRKPYKTKKSEFKFTFDPTVDYDALKVLDKPQTNTKIRQRSPVCSGNAFKTICPGESKSTLPTVR